MDLLPQQLDRLTFLLTDRWIDPGDDPDYTNSWRVFAGQMAEVQSGVELHCLAGNLNHDYGLAGLRQVVNHPLCDRGTILMLYWLRSPTFLPYDQESAAFLAELELRYQELPPSTIAFTPPPRSARDAPDPRSVPRIMEEPAKGRDLGGLVEAVRLVASMAWFSAGAISSGQLQSSFAVRVDHVGERFADTVRKALARLAALEQSPAKRASTLLEIRDILLANASEPP